MSPYVRFRHLMGTLRWRLIHLAGNRQLEPTEAQQWLAGIARYAHMVAGDLSSLAHAQGADARHRMLRSYRARLGRLHREMAAFEADVKAASRRHVWKQHDRLVGKNKKLKLNLGGGFTAIEDWVSVDTKSGDLLTNLLRQLPFADHSVDFAFMCHVLEHFYFPLEALTVLKEVHRVLKPGGVLRIVVPDIRQCLLAYASGDKQFFILRDKELFGKSRDRNLLEYFLNYAGATNGPDTFMFSHKYGYDAVTLSKLLKDAGFIPMPSEYMSSTFPELRIDKFSSSARAEVNGRKLSLFMDAAVPAAFGS